MALATGGDEKALRLALMRYVSGTGIPQAVAADDAADDVDATDADEGVPEQMAIPVFDQSTSPASEAAILIG